MNTALNRTVVALLTNKSGGALNFGDVVIGDTANVEGFTTTTTAGYSATQIGVILEPNGIANNASGMVATAGWVPQLNLNTAATAWQLIKTHTVAGQGTPHSSPQVEGDFAIALDASATPSAILFGSPNPPSAGGSVTTGVTLTAGKTVIGAGASAIDISSLTAQFAGSSSGTLAAASMSTARLLGRTTASSGAVEEISVGSGLTLSAGSLSASGSSGLMLLESHAASASASLDFLTRNASGQSGNTFQSDYDEYVISVTSLINGSAAVLGFRMSTGGGTFDSGSNYNWAFDYAITSSSGGAGSNSDTTMNWRGGSSTTLATGGTWNGSFHLFDPLNASTYKHATGQICFRDNPTGIILLNWGGIYTSATAVVGFQILPSAGTLTSGTAYVYGVKKS